jgi:hypothetical protein
MASVTWLSAVSADWSVAADWSTGTVPGAADDVFLNAAGAYVVSIAAGESFTANSLNMGGGGTVAVAGTLDFDNASGSSFSVGSLTVEPGGVLSGEGVVFGPGPVLNQGTMVGNVDIRSGGQALFITPAGSFTNQGLMLATAGGNLDIDTGKFSTFANITGGVLTGGSYQADTVSTLVFVTPGAAVAFTTIDAALTFNGSAAEIDNNRSGTGTFTSVEDALTNIGAAGLLNILGGRDYTASVALTDRGALTLGGGTLNATGLTVTSGGTIIGHGMIEPAIANAGTVEAAGGFLTLAGGISDGGALRVDADATMVLNGTFARPITDNGTMQAQDGTLSLVGAIGGSGGFVIQGGSASALTVLKLGSASNNPVAFNGAFGDLILDAPATFSGSIVGFGAGDSIDLAGIVANGATLTGSALDVTNNGSLVDTLSLTGNYVGGVFSATSDLTGGTAITVSSVAPRDYVFEGPYWQAKTITWSFATSNLADDASAPFSSSFDPTTQASAVAVVDQALARWAGIAGLNFVNVADSPSVDLRIGWGDLIGAGLGEIGQASFKFLGNAMLPDGIVRIEDPAETALVANAGVIGGLSYGTLETTMYQVALHEIGHALGMAHSADPHAVMFPTATGVPNQDADASDIAGMQALYAAVACFTAGTRILTARGELPVEALSVGDVVRGLVSGRLRRVRWIGQRSLDAARHPRPHEVAPIRVRAGAFTAGLPHRDLLLSPDHALLIGRVLVPVRYLVNGVTVLREPVGCVTYFHVELAEEDGTAVHDVMLAEGLPAESYLDTGNRAAFANGGDAGDGEGAAPMLLHPDFARHIWETRACAPLHVEGPVVVAARWQLLVRAPALGFALDNDPDFCLLADDTALRPFARRGRIWRFHVPRGSARLVSRSAVPAEVRADDADCRKLGVAITRIALNGKPIPLDDPALGDGFRPVERSGRRRWRWTDGDAVLHLPASGRLDVTLAFTLPYWVATSPEQTRTEKARQA